MNASAQQLLETARTLPSEHLPRFLGELEEIRTTALARLTIAPMAIPARDELLDVSAAAERLGISKDYLYRHHAEYAFTRHIGRKLLFSSQGIDTYIKRSR